MILALALSACGSSSRPGEPVPMPLVQIDRGTVYVKASLPGQTEQLVAVVGRPGNTPCDSVEVWVTADLSSLPCGAAPCPNFHMDEGLFHTPPGDPGYTEVTFDWRPGFVDPSGAPLAVPAFCPAWEAELRQRWPTLPASEVECWTMDTCPTWLPSQGNTAPPQPAAPTPR